ncbi:RNA-binding protein [Candidatus Giovannonibacteria bacterium RIFCSPHIGHO2_01_FULL_48_47]|nr:MAG: RNA-binding protein [Candidatus Giovannonibacteria bacterium RIFCSPHIGHO2_01_FULL_48_47]OGF87953.1 MAG: RNA-binding protein [Candidatus Giovannonibacteria bacterium RIFCSPLOWO2_01_FULL_48_47]OGF95837.1 MAG: RNA-binding protein [Candidatus Giovannonibacteria bacterium RIFOXYD1_FULL_48_21]HBT81099.1 RNA-binding protein [Candidatus Giovannonibacteria bacterium]
MSTKLYVGSLSYSTTDESLREHFAQAGTVQSASVVMDKMTGRSRGFGFVEMASDEEAKKAIETLNGKELDGRALVVNEARPAGEGGAGRPRGGGFPRRGGGGGFGSRGGYGRKEF